MSFYITIKEIDWGEHSQPNSECPYDHVIGKSPVGDFLITWKGWKDSPDFQVECPPHAESNYLFDNYTLDGAKQSAQRYLEDFILRCIDNVRVD